MKPTRTTNPETAKQVTSTLTVQRLVDGLDFTPENCIEAACANPGLFIEAVRFRLDQLAERNAAKLAFEQKEAETDLRIRQEHRAADMKITEAVVSAYVALNVDVVSARQRLNRAEENEELGKGLVEAYRMRRDCLQIVERVASEERRLAGAAEANAAITKTREQLRQKYKDDPSLREL